MAIDFTPVEQGELTLIELAETLTLDDLRDATNESIDTLLGFLDGLHDEHVTFDPVDPDADDPYAVSGEEKIGWSLAHLVAHVTASSEEGAAMSSQLARGVRVKLRNRYETPWREITTVVQCVQRLEESRRMRLAFLETWPDEPHLDVYRKISREYEAKHGKLNAPASFIKGLHHEVGHYEQFRKVRQQALEAVACAGC